MVTLVIRVILRGVLKSSEWEPHVLFFSIKPLWSLVHHLCSFVWCILFLSSPFMVISLIFILAISPLILPCSLGTIKKWTSFDRKGPPRCFMIMEAQLGGKNLNIFSYPLLSQIFLPQNSNHLKHYSISHHHKITSQPFHRRLANSLLRHANHQKTDSDIYIFFRVIT